MISDYISKHSKQIHKDFDVTQAEMDALFALNSFQTDVTAVEISEALLFTSGGVSKVLKKLEDKGLISREVSQIDKRSALIHLEKAGLEIVLACEPIFRERDDQIFSVLDDKEKEILRKALKKVLFSVTQ